MKRIYYIFCEAYGHESEVVRVMLASPETRKPFRDAEAKEHAKEIYGRKNRITVNGNVMLAAIKATII